MVAETRPAPVSNSFLVEAEAGRAPGGFSPEFRTVQVVGLIAIVLFLGWTVIILSQGAARFAFYSPTAEIGEEAATALASLFGAVVLTLFPSTGQGDRLRWVAAGFVVLGFGAVLFGYLEPSAGVSPPLNTTMYIALAIRLVVGVLLVIGFVPRTPPPFTRTTAWACVLGSGVLLAAVSLFARHFPPLVEGISLRQAAQTSTSTLQGLTAWHWILGPVTLLVTVAAIAGAARHLTRRGIDAWVLIALLFLAFSQLHNVFWPSTYTGVLTTANLLRLAFATIIVVGGIFELRRIALERARMLALSEEHGRRLEELAELKSGFTAMVAHELGSPLAAIRATAATLATGSLSAGEQAESLHVIDTQIDLLAGLTADMQTASTVERPEFAIQLRPVPAGILVSDALAYARTLPGDHPLSFPAVVQEIVFADKDRVAQVLQNLLSNAAKYSEVGTPIALSVDRENGRLRFTVRDQGYGIHPDDMQRIFEKFGRGRDRSGRRVSGVGLGLYLSRRIVQEHGSELFVASIPNDGSVFSFDLEVLE